MQSDAPTLRARNASRLVAQAEAAATARPFQTIPQIDISPLLEGTVDERLEVASAIRQACLEVGFFYVSDHGVDPSIVAAGFEAAERFFALPEADKAAVSILHSDKLRGYTGLLEENTDPDNNGDLHEAFDIGLDLANDDPDAHSGVYGWGENQWPELQGTVVGACWTGAATC